MSRRPGLGSDYIRTHAKWHLDGLRGLAKVNGNISRLPRFLKEKIFKDKNGEWLVDPELLLGDYSEVQQYREELARLAPHHDSPVEYYVERKKHNHDAIKHKSNALNKF